ncbi:MAG: type I DNA topoisomerase [Chlamydiota bacterium]
MGKILIIVESPTKIKTLQKFVGSGISFESSLGHIRDLPQKEFGIDTEHDFEPHYVNLPEKKDVIKKLKLAAQNSDVVYLAPDPDREGEAIAWHIASVLPKDIPIKRITFNSITRNAVLDSLQHPRDIDMGLVNAQQARRLLDRIVGYKISPILTRKIKRGKSGTSAGRVQSVALKLVVDREKEIDAFIPIEYWTIKALLSLPKEEKPFEATVETVDGKKVDKEPKENVYLIPDQIIASSVVDKLRQAAYTVGPVEKKEKKRNPVPPFITSTLQQEASRHYGFSVTRTMSIAQELYEGVDMGEEGAEGLITYMRTDSVQVAPEAITNARSFIANEYGKEYLPETPRFYASKKSAQEAHEAIRPTNLLHPPEKIKNFLTTDQYKIYLLIWRRFVASQMNPAIYDTISAEIETDKNITLRATGSIIKFSGFLAVYEEKKDKGEAEEEEVKLLPPLEEGKPLRLDDLLPVQSVTKAPPRFTEASLVKELEKSCIVIRSTYATIMNKIQNREYTVKENNTLRPTELGKIIAQMLEENFKPIMNVGFTAAMEDDLELVAENKRNWKGLIKEFWEAFIPMVTKAEKEAMVPKLITEHLCPKCQKPLQKIWSRNKYFYGCSGYPDCDFTSSVETFHFKKEDFDENFDWDQLCPKCQAPMVLRHGRFGTFLGCSKYPECKGIINIPKKGEKEVGDIPCPAIGCEGKILRRKTRFGKTFYSCSSFPDCDVIVNEIADLETKYDAHHPKTAYVKKEKGSRFKKEVKGKKPKTTKTKEASSRLLKLSEELSDIVGAKELSRADVLKKIWDYIKVKNLQDPKNKRRIIPDEKLEKIFMSKEPIDMMKLAGLLSPHIKK